MYFRLDQQRGAKFIFPMLISQDRAQRQQIIFIIFVTRSHGRIFKGLSPKSSRMCVFMTFHVKRLPPVALALAQNQGRCPGNQIDFLPVCFLWNSGLDVRVTRLW